MPEREKEASQSRGRFSRRFGSRRKTSVQYRYRHVKTKKTMARKRSTDGQLAGGLVEPPRDIETFGRVKTNECGPLIKRRRPFAYPRPFRGVKLEVVGTLFEVNAGSWCRIGPTKRPSSCELFKQLLGQRDITLEIQVLRVVKQMIIQNSVRALAGKHRGAIDQDGMMTLRHGSYCRAKFVRAP